jgi:hypothetical protein
LAAKRLKMNRLKEIVRLSLERGLSQRKVARALRVGWPLPAELEDEERLEAAVLGAAKAPEAGADDAAGTPRGGESLRGLLGQETTALSPAAGRWRGPGQPGGSG